MFTKSPLLCLKWNMTIVRQYSVIYFTKPKASTTTVQDKLIDSVVKRNYMQKIIRLKGVRIWHYISRFIDYDRSLIFSKSLFVVILYLMMKFCWNFWVGWWNPVLMCGHKGTIITSTMLTSRVNVKANFVLHMSSYNYGLVRKMWCYYYQYVIIIIHVLFSWCCFDFLNCVSDVPRITIILCWKARTVMCDSTLGLTRSKHMSLSCIMYSYVTCVNNYLSQKSLSSCDSIKAWFISSNNHGMPMKLKLGHTPLHHAIPAAFGVFSYSCSYACYLTSADRLSDFIVTLSNVSFPVTSAQLVPPAFIRCGQHHGYPGPGQTGTVTCSPGPSRGRYVFISLPNPGILTMCETRVFAGRSRATFKICRYHLLTH